jgi:hypothetical protein
VAPREERVVAPAAAVGRRESRDSSGRSLRPNCQSSLSSSLLLRCSRERLCRSESAPSGSFGSSTALSSEWEPVWKEPARRRKRRRAEEEADCEQRTGWWSGWRRWRSRRGRRDSLSRQSTLRPGREGRVRGGRRERESRLLCFLAQSSIHWAVTILTFFQDLAASYLSPSGRRQTK